MYTSPIENWDASLLIEKGKLKVVVEQGLFYLPSDITFRNWTSPKLQIKGIIYTAHSRGRRIMCKNNSRGWQLKIWVYEDSGVSTGFCGFSKGIRGSM